MKTKSFLAWALAAVIVLLLAANLTVMLLRVPFRGTLDNNEMGKKKQGMMLNKKLNLNEDQQTFFRETRSKFKSEARLIHDSLVKLNFAFVEEMDKEMVDSARVDYLLDQMCIQHGLMKRKMSVMYQELKGKCTLEQKAMLKEHFRDFMPHEFGHRNKGIDSTKCRR